MDFAAGEDHHHHHQPPIEHTLTSPILLSERIRQAINDSNSFKLELSDVGKLVDRLSQMLRSFVRSTNSTTTPSFYDRPVRRIFTDVSKTLTRTLTLVRKCRRRTVFLRIVGAADFRKIFNLLEASIGDMKWLLSVFDTGGEYGVVLSLPPIASNDPILAWVWSYIASLYLHPLNVKIEVANELCSLARDNDRNKKIIVEEGGIPPLLKLLKEASSPESQIAGAITLFNLGNNQERARLIADELGVSIIVQAFGRESPISVRIAIAKLICRMSEFDPVSREGFGRENVIRPLVMLLSFETFVDDDRLESVRSVLDRRKTRGYEAGSSSWSMNRRERESEPPELKLELKTSCARALWMLARGNLANCRMLTDTKGLLCLAKIIETETGELLINCLMTVMEIASAAESNADLRRSTFKTNSPAARAIVDQFLRLIQESENSVIKIPAIRAIGLLARTFPARETRVIGPLVKQLNHPNPDVGTESAIALGKFVSPDNFLCTQHSKTVIEFEGVVPLMRLLRGSERTQYHALVVLCYLALHAGNSEALVQARVLTALEGADRAIVGQHSELKELVVKAIYHLNMYHAGVVPPQRPPYSN
ncbi:hypothetical protein L6452_21255 [Arctium lappa]|uniref:Uncharacterized protein n=1 Tax=Arctium lappa TaxID=4217 RepID=A0ACB9BEI3_ARCLA|nr:hypothetical protein L6452_21255 [Arctium lappa]